MMRYRYLWLMTSISLFGAAFADEIHSLTELEQQIYQFVDDHVQGHADKNDEIQAHIGHLDSRLRLKQCETPLKMDIESGHFHQQNFTVKVSCQQPTKWSIRVPVKVHHYKMIAVATEPLPKGHLLSHADINMVKQDVGQIADGYFSSPDKIVGLVLQRNISAGNVIKKNMLKEPTLIHKGETVRMVLQTEGFSIESTGVAQNDGAKGQTIAVKNSRSNRVVEAVVQEPGVAVIPM